MTRFGPRGFQDSGKYHYIIDTSGSNIKTINASIFYYQKKRQTEQSTTDDVIDFDFDDLPFSGLSS